MLNIKLALRTLFKSPFVTVVAVVSLALGIGANTAIFSLFHEFVLRSLPVQEPSRLVNLSAPGPKPGSQTCNQAGDCDVVFSYPMFRDLERVQTTFTGIAAHRLFGANLAYRGQTLSGEGVFVSGSYFPVLGMQPALGRLLDPGDDRSVGESPVAVLSHGWWLSRFGADPNVLNDTIIVNGQSLTIVGVAPRGFTGTTLGATPQVFVPDHPARHPAARVQALRRSAHLLGLHFRAPEARRLARSGEDSDQRALPADRERRGGSAPAGHERPDDGPVQGQGHRDGGRLARAELGSRRSPHAAAAPPRRDRARAGHRVRQHRQPAPRARRRARQRDGHPALARGEPAAAHLAAARRVVPARAARRRGRHARRPLDARLHHLDSARRRGREPSLVHQHHGAAFCRRAHPGHGPALRPVPGAAQHAARSGLDAQGPGGPAIGREGGPAVSDDAGHRSDRALDDAPRLRGPLHQEPAERQPRRPRHQGGQRRHVRNLARAQRLQVGAVAPAVRASRRGARGAAGRHRRHDRARAAPRRQQLGQRRAGRGLPVRARYRQ